MAARWCIVLPLVLGLSVPGPTAILAAEPTRTPWDWPVVGPILRPFDPPEDPYGSGHRGIDIAAAVGTPVLAPADGTVAFAGPVGGQLFVTLDHGGGLTSTYSWLSAVEVRRGQAVPRGARLGLTGSGHPGGPVPHLHLGAKLDDAYVDPLSLLGPAPVADLIHLAPGPTPG
jgi:murein DD-endopeptidase MepM/ murein hydrolase activator NlpD